MIEQARLLPGNARLEEGIALALAEHRAFEKRHHLIEDRQVAGDLDIVRCDVSQPTAIVGDARADTATGFRQPPMLHVAFEKLPASSPQQVLAREIWPRDAERHDVL